MQYFLITYENEKFYVEVDSQNTPCPLDLTDRIVNSGKVGK